MSDEQKMVNCVITASRFEFNGDKYAKGDGVVFGKLFAIRNANAMTIIQTVEPELGPEPPEPEVVTPEPKPEPEPEPAPKPEPKPEPPEPKPEQERTNAPERAPKIEPVTLKSTKKKP